LPTDRALRAIAAANATTGSAVPMPKADGSSSRDSCFRASGTRLAKNSPAEMGQNDRAKRMPSRAAPRSPPFSASCCARSPPTEVENRSGTSSSSTTPTAMRIGPSSRFMYVWRNWETAGIASSPPTATTATATYAAVRPSV